MQKSRGDTPRLFWCCSGAPRPEVFVGSGYYPPAGGRLPPLQGLSNNGAHRRAGARSRRMQKTPSVSPQSSSPAPSRREPAPYPTSVRTVGADAHIGPGAHSRATRESPLRERREQAPALRVLSEICAKRAEADASALLILALSGACGDTSPRGRGWRVISQTGCRRYPTKFCGTPPR